MRRYQRMQKETKDAGTANRPQFLAVHPSPPEAAEMALPRNNNSTSTIAVIECLL
jgi:hypothetical protein